VNANPAASVFFVVPDMIDDPERVSGGNVYDQRVRDGLTADGWELRMLPVADRQAETARTLSQLPDGALVLIDGLLVAREPDALLDQAPRLAVVVLAHGVAPDLGDRERDALRSARAIIATSRWTRAELIERDAADPHRIVVAHPGTEPAPPTVASASGGRLLCVATVAPHKGQDLLVRALTRVADIDGWTCTMAGSLRAAPEFVARLTDEVEAAGLTDRVTFTGVLSGSALEDAYGRADLAIAPSRHESYGMAVAEALARGIPVLASHVGGISEAIGESGGEAVAGEAAGGEAAMIVPPDDAWALEVVLRRWLTDPAGRRRRTAAALQARSAIRPWTATTDVIASSLREAARVEVARP
jgi:glycosyltransferase involved in cell wall biosynthesis